MKLFIWIGIDIVLLIFSTIALNAWIIHSKRKLPSLLHAYDRHRRHEDYGIFLAIISGALCGLFLLLTLALLLPDKH